MAGPGEIDALGHDRVVGGRIDIGALERPASVFWYVDDDAPNDPGPGDPNVSDPDEDGSPEHPFDAIQEGIDAAVDGGETADGIYEGVYHGG